MFDVRFEEREGLDEDLSHPLRGFFPDQRDQGVVDLPQGLLVDVLQPLDLHDLEEGENLPVPGQRIRALPFGLGGAGLQPVGDFLVGPDDLHVSRKSEEVLQGFHRSVLRGEAVQGSEIFPEAQVGNILEEGGGRGVRAGRRASAPQAKSRGPLPSASTRKRPAGCGPGVR